MKLLRFMNHCVLGWPNSIQLADMPLRIRALSELPEGKVSNLIRFGNHNVNFPHSFVDRLFHVRFFANREVN